VRVELEANAIKLPAFASAHSHAFQRALRGRAERPIRAQADDDFWSWRTAMYEVAGSVDPESLYRIALVAYRELRQAGVLTVGEFHYLHHQPDGSPYDDRTVMADALIRAARDAGIRIALLRGVYGRSAPGKPAEGAQRRFCDARPEDALADVERLAGRYAADPAVRIGLAPHSVRAVPPDWLPELARYAFVHALPFHMHVAEQPLEVDLCRAETKKTPVEVLADAGALGPQLVAVHATHVTESEAKLLGDAGAFVCLCPTTERDLGDRLPPVELLRAAHVRLCTGVDSHVVTDPFEDMRGIELGERQRTGKRLTQRLTARPAEFLWRAASEEGAWALGFDDTGGVIEIARDAPALALVEDEYVLDAIVFSGSPSMVRQVVPQASGSPSAR
jgi:formiminoglutamate deiminase